MVECQAPCMFEGLPCSEVDANIFAAKQVMVMLLCSATSCCKLCDTGHAMLCSEGTLRTGSSLGAADSFSQYITP